MTDKNVLPIIVKKEVDDSHYYFVNEEYFPSVTAILDQAAPVGYGLRSWLLANTAESADEIKSTTAALGSKLHDAYQSLLLGKKLNMLDGYPSTKEKKHIVSFYNWFAGFAPDITSIQTEHTVASVSLKYAGTLDLAIMRNNERWIIDFKTTSGIYYSHELQVVAYKRAYEEMYKVNVDHVAILRTGTRHKDGFEFKEVTRGFGDFKAVYDTYLAMNGGEIPAPPLINTYPLEVQLFVPADEKK